MKTSRENHVDNPTKKETHTLDFRGAFAPGDLWQLLSEKVITDEMLVVGMLIDSLVKIKGRGCWASNAYLADYTGKTTRQIQRIIRALMGFRLVNNVWKKTGPELVWLAGSTTVNGKKHRLLETAWSRITDKRGSVIVDRFTDDKNVAGAERRDDKNVVQIEDKRKEDKNKRCCNGRRSAPASNKSSSEKTDSPPQIPISKEENPEESESKRAPQLPISNVPQKRKGQNTVFPTDTDSFHVQCARRFCEALKNRHGVLPPRFKKGKTITAWAKEFAAMEKEDECPREKLKEVLDWYIANLHLVGTDPYMINVKSAKSFRDKFINLTVKKSNMEKSEVHKTNGHVPNVISDDAKKVLESLKGVNWPNGVPTGLPTAVQTCLDDFRKLRKDFKRVLVRIQDKEIEGLSDAKLNQLRRVVEYLRGQWNDPLYFVERWFKRVAKKIEGWEEWGGSFKKYTLQPGNDFTDEYARKVLKDHGLDDGYWNLFVKEIGR